MDLSFNLAIEILIFSAHKQHTLFTGATVSFQSRNRDTYIFSHVDFLGTGTIKLFQSRNRDTYIFSDTTLWQGAYADKFQSRNRDTYIFSTYAAAEAAEKAYVSISQSRYLYFQLLPTGTLIICAVEGAISVSGVFWLGKRSNK